MKVKISNAVSGEFHIPAMKKTFRRGMSVPMSHDEFFDSTTQWAIRNGYLLVEEGGEMEANRPQGQEFRLISKNPLALRCVGRTINPGEVFYVAHDKLSDGELAIVVDRGMVVKEANFKAAAVTKTAPVAPKTEKTTKLSKASKKKEETPAKLEVKTEAKPPEIPKNMHVYVPEKLKDEIKPTVPPGRTTIVLDLNEGAPETGELSFVDQEQADARKLNIAKDNEEVV